jgi:hypothetical protein
VATLARALPIVQSGFNNPPFGARFLASANDPTVNRPLPDNFLRPYIGYQSIQMLQQTATSNYNSLQMQLNRRFTHGLQFAASYVWSKAMGYARSSNATYYNGRLDYGRLNFDVRSEP